MSDEEPIQEPSVLDYVKARLNPWRKEKIEIPPAADEDATTGSSAGLRLPAVTINLPAYRPWRTTVAILLALFAQWLLEASARPLEMKSIVMVVGMYALAFGLLVWALLVNEFSLPETETVQPQTDNPQKFRRQALFIAIILAVLAYTQFNQLDRSELTLTNKLISLFGQNENAQHDFTTVNLVLWLGAIGLFVYSLWLPDSTRPVWWKRLQGFLRREAWQINLTRFGLLLLAVIALVVFFRFYRLSGIPSDPFSDHAEKLLDVFDVTQGKYHVFFERNTGREFIQFYWTVLMAWIFKTGLTFMSLKIGTVLIGLFALPYIYLLGKEVGGKRVALFALILAGTAYWLNTISRIGLRFPLYPAFAAPVLYYLVRGLRRQQRNDFILSGLFLGLGMHGYSPFRFVPVVVVLAFGLYVLHAASKGFRKQSIMMFVILVLASILVFIPLGRYAVDRPDMFSYRALTRVAGDNLPTTGSPFERFWTSLTHPVSPDASDPLYVVFFWNTFKALIMFQYDNGSIWVHSVPGRPALEFVSAALFTLGCLFLFLRYLQKRDWLDLFMLLAIPMLLMPSILSLAFPDENPSLNRTGAAAVVVFIIAAQALDGLYSSLRGVRSEGESGRTPNQVFALVVVIALLGISIQQNYKLVFHDFATQFTAGAWNTSDMGKVIRAFVTEGNDAENAWVVPFPYWVDTRLVGIQSGFPTRDAALWPEAFAGTKDIPGNKLFIVKDEDLTDLGLLRELYPNGALGKFDSPLDGKDFWILTVSDNSTVEQP